MSFYLQAVSKDMREVKAKMQTYVDEKESMLGEHQDYMKRKAKLELDIKDLSEEIDGEANIKVSNS